MKDRAMTATPKRFTTERGFKLLLHGPRREVYRNGRHFLVRELDQWFAQTGQSVWQDNGYWRSPPMGSVEAAFAFAEVEGWGGPT